MIPLRLSVNVSSVFAVEKQHCPFLVAHLIAHPIVSNTYSVLVLFAFQLDASTRARVVSERRYPIQHAPVDVARQAVELFLHGPRYYNPVAGRGDLSSPLPPGEVVLDAHVVSALVGVASFPDFDPGLRILFGDGFDLLVQGLPE